MLTRKNEIVGITKLMRINNKIYLCGSEIKSKRDFYNIPISSSYLDIYATNGSPAAEEKSWSASSIKKKLFAMRFENDIVFSPLIHGS